MEGPDFGRSAAYLAPPVAHALHGDDANVVDGDLDKAIDDGLPMSLMPYMSQNHHDVHIDLLCTSASSIPVHIPIYEHHDFITGQLMMFISIYYAPLHLALGRPHTITVLALPYLLFHFFWNNHKHFFDYGSTTRNSMRNLSIQCVFLNNLIFQLLNHFILPSSMLARLVNIYMFRCNNKMLFVTSSFVGWLIGHILFMKWVGLVLVWIRQNPSIRSNVLIQSNKYLVSELRNSMARIFSILLFITCVYYLGRIPSPILTRKLKETSETEERGESEE